MKQCYLLLIKGIFLLFLLSATNGFAQKKILVFSKTAGYRHSSIDYGIDAVRKIGNNLGFAVESSENAADFTAAKLSVFSAVIFMSTTGDILNSQQQAAFEQYIRSGGGYIGVHAATDTEYDWPWYGKLVGAWFNGHPEIQEARLNIAGKEHPGNDNLPSPWTRTDEWYNFGNFQSTVTTLLRLDESSYSGGTMGNDHPVAWYHEFDGGRAWYTSLGHTDESFSDEDFLSHLQGGITFATGNAQANAKPTANAGADQQIKLPQATVTLKGKGTDTDGNITSFKWTKSAGPAGGAIGSPSLAETKITDLQKGTYRFRLTVTDNDGDTGYDEVQIVVAEASTPPANQLPKANAGPNQTISLPLNTITLRGSGTDADGEITSYLWTRISGPATGVVIKSPAAGITNVTGLKEGTYIFRLKVTDNAGATAIDDVQIKVGPPLSNSNQQPIADAGQDKTISLPVSSTLLSGEASHDNDGSISVWSWVKISGPIGGQLSGGNTDLLSLSMLEQGTYVFELTVTDNRGSSASDSVTVFVLGSNGPNQLPVISIEDSFFVRLPVQNIELDASRSYDPDGMVKSVAWKYLKGPREPQILNPASTKTIVAGLIPGTYLFNITITDNGGASVQKNVYVVVKNSTARRLIPTVGFFPNPAQKRITLTVDAEINGRTQVTFYDIAGRPVLSAALIKTARELVYTFDIDKLSKGIYLVVIDIERAEKVVRQIVRQ